MEEKNYPTLKLESALEEIIVEAEKAYPNDKNPNGFFSEKVASDDTKKKRKDMVKELFFEKFQPKKVIDYENAFDNEQLKTEIIENFESQKDNLLYIEWDYYEDLPIIILGKYSEILEKELVYDIETGERGTTQEKKVSVKAIKFLKPDKIRPAAITHGKVLTILPKIEYMINSRKKHEIYSIEINSIEGEATGNEEKPTGNEEKSTGNEDEQTGNDDEDEQTGGKRKKTRKNKKKSSKKSKKKNTKKNKTKKKGKK